MSRFVAVADTSVLITLDAAASLEHLDQLFTRVLVPAAVRSEFLIGEEKRLNRSTGALDIVLTRAPFEACTSYDTVDLEFLLAYLRGRGEAEALAQSKFVQATHVLLDEQRARALATRQKLRVMGSARILAHLHVIGLCPDYLAAISNARALAGVHISDEIAAEALRLARSGEF